MAKIVILIDQFTDGNDEFKTIIGTQPQPNNKAEQIYVQHKCEERNFGCIRQFIKVSESIMIDDCLNKIMKSYLMANMLTYGWLMPSNEEKQKIRTKKGVSLSRRSYTVQLLDDRPTSAKDSIKDDYTLLKTYFLDKPTQESHLFFQLLD